MTGMAPSSRVLSHQQPRLTTLVTHTAMPTDFHAETLPKALGLQLLSTIAKMRHNAGKGAKVAEQHYKGHYDTHMGYKSRFGVGPLE